ncbi:MAG: zinc protease, partial [Candidatus Aldehydirespiratoraceae bacterium]
MRIPVTTLIVLLLAFALLAAACTDDPAAQELIEDLIQGVDPVDDSTFNDFEIPDASTPEVDDTPLPVDDNYRIGVLDNGLTYMLRSNDTPGGSLDLRLVVNAGALQQPVAEDGSAHFLEHMLFNGTEAFPGNELTTQLQRYGIRFGADVNAYTSYDETVYLLGAPTSDPAAPTVAFDVLREWASRATIEPAEVDAEIGVVRDELRQRGESVQGIIGAQLSQIYTRGTPYEGHDPIGEAELIESTTAETLREFYETWYRPDLMAIVVVGDVPLDRLEEEVTSRFADLPPAAADAPARNEVTVDLDATPVTEVIVHPDNGANFISFDLPLPAWDSGTVGGERMRLVEQAVAAMLDTRLNEAFQRGDLAIDQSPYINPGFAENREQRFYGTSFQADDLEVGLNDYMSHLLLAAADGFTDDDVARVQTQLIAAIEDERATLGSIQDFQYADALTSNYLTGSDLDIAPRRLSRQSDAVETLTVDELTNYWRWLLQSSGPVVVAITDDPSAVPTADALAEILANARPATQGAAAAEVDQLMAAPDAAEVISTDVRAGGFSDVTEWQFANGVVVTHQQTEITDGSFDIWVEST